MAVAARTRSSRRRRREDVRAALVRALSDLTQDSSFRDLTIDEIARAAGLSRSAFYFYFEDKHELLMAAASRVADELYREADRWWHGEGAPEVLVREALTGIATVYARHSRLLGVAMEVSTYDDEVRAFWRALVERFIAATEDHLRAEQAAGRAAALAPRGAAESLVWMAERCFYIYLRDGERSVEELVDQLSSTWMAALYPSEHPAGP